MRRGNEDFIVFFSDRHGMRFSAWGWSTPRCLAIQSPIEAASLLSFFLRQPDDLGMHVRDSWLCGPASRRVCPFRDEANCNPAHMLGENRAKAPVRATH